MRLLIPCTKCFQDASTPTLALARVEVRDDGRYELTCPNGHESITLLQQEKFEVLVDIGAYAAWTATIEKPYRRLQLAWNDSTNLLYAYFFTNLA